MRSRSSLVLMSGPLHPGANETEVTRFALKHDIDWFERHVIHTVPRRYPGRNRRVYPGLVQLGAFMSTQLSRHVSQHMDLFMAVMRMREEDAQKIMEFYDEYLAVQDLAADFYLDTLHRVFQRRDLPNGQFDWHGRPVDPGRDRDGAAGHDRGREGRYLRPRPDLRRARHVPQPAGRAEGPPSPAGSSAISARSAARNTARASCPC